MAKSRKSRKLNLTEKYERRRIWAGYFGLAFKEMKRATKKALQAINKAIKQKRLELRQEGVTDIPTVSQVAKYERQRKQLENQEEQEREPLPYAPVDEIPEYNEYEDVINEFLSTMGYVMQEAINIYGLSQPHVARDLENSLTEMLRTFNEARAIKGDKYVADYISNSLDFQRIYDMVFSDSVGRAEAVEEVESIIMGMMDGM